MLFTSDKKEFSPVARSFRQLLRKLRNMVIVVFAVGLMLVFLGVPSIQYTYRHHPISGTPTATDKINADYWNPISGWQVVRADEFGRGCPVIVFIPLRRCVNLEPYKNSFTLFFLEEVFHGS